MSDRSPRCKQQVSRDRWGRWIPHPILLGFFSLLWLLARSGRKPTRLAYPCQRAALGHAALLIGLPLAHAFHRTMGRLGGKRLELVTLGVGAAALVIAGFWTPGSAPSPPPDGPHLTPRADYNAHVYLVDDAGGPSGDHHLGVDELLACLGAGGVKFYRSPAVGPEAGPEGVVGSEDVVLIKINQQWPQRGGTNIDVLKGLITRVLEHPDGFAGEVVVVENTQGAESLDLPQSNGEDPNQSAQDVINDFAGSGHPVSGYLWDSIRTTSVSEYDTGDMQDGYVVGPYLSDTHIRVSYPKFLTAGGEYVSLKHGLWDPGSATYDDMRLTFLNVPVLKCHGAVYGVTGAVKHHVGTMTTLLQTGTHGAVRYGGCGSFLADVRMPDLNILDCIYILAQPNNGPWCLYGDATRVDKLVASLDPVALDLWATANILVPTILENGYTSYPKQDPGDPGSIFRIYLDASTDALLAAGIDVTNDLDQIVMHQLDDVGVEIGGVPAPASAMAYPNPFEHATAIRFDAPVSGEIRVDVYDVTGRRIRSLTTTATAGAAAEVTWDGRDESGRVLPSGSYYCKLAEFDTPLSGKVTLLR